MSISSPSTERRPSAEALLSNFSLEMQRLRSNDSDIKTPANISNALPASTDDGPSGSRDAHDHAEYRVYKRRFFGLLQLVLLNIAVSWDVSESDPEPSWPRILKPAVAYLRCRLRYVRVILRRIAKRNQLAKHGISLRFRRSQSVHDLDAEQAGAQRRHCRCRCADPGWELDPIYWHAGVGRNLWCRSVRSDNHVSILRDGVRV